MNKKIKNYEDIYFWLEGRFGKAAYGCFTGISLKSSEGMAESRFRNYGVFMKPVLRRDLPFDEVLKVIIDETFKGETKKGTQVIKRSDGMFFRYDVKLTLEEYSKDSIFIGIKKVHMGNKALESIRRNAADDKYSTRKERINALDNFVSTSTITGVRFTDKSCFFMGPHHFVGEAGDSFDETIVKGITHAILNSKTNKTDNLKIAHVSVELLDCTVYLTSEEIRKELLDVAMARCEGLLPEHKTGYPG